MTRLRPVTLCLALAAAGCSSGSSSATSGTTSSGTTGAAGTTSAGSTTSGASGSPTSGSTSSSSTGSGSSAGSSGSSSSGTTGSSDAGLPVGAVCDGGQVCQSQAACLPAYDGGSFCLQTCPGAANSCNAAGEVCGPILPPLLYACFPQSDAGCELGNVALLPDLSFTYDDSCITTADCPCPFECLTNPDLGDGGFCGQRCKTTADCLDPQKSCTAGFCSFDFCVQDLQHAVANGTIYDGTCNGMDAGDGNCLPTASGNPTGYSGICRQAGSVPVGGACDAVAGRDRLALQCAAGAICVPDSGVTEYGNCAALCTPGDGGGVACPTGMACTLPDPSQPLLGTCAPM